MGVRNQRADEPPRGAIGAMTTTATDADAGLAPTAAPATPPQQSTPMLRTSRRSTGTVTLDDVASHAGVSPQTVSRSLRSPELVSAATLERVLSSISATGYVLNHAASNLASNRSKTVAAVIPVILASVFADSLHGLEEVLSSAGYHLFIGSTDYDTGHEDEIVAALLGRRPDGVFIVGTNHSDRTRAMLAGANVPIVEAWELTEDPIDSVVGFSNRAAIRSLVEFVHAKGYRHPTFAGSLRTSDFRAVARRASFEASVADLYPGEAIRVLDSGAPRVDYETGARLLHETLERHPETDVLMFASDVFAAGAILECLRLGIDVPGRIAITGFGDFDIARHLVPPLTTVAVPTRAIGTKAGELLLQRMMPGPRSAIEQAGRVVDLGFTIMERASA